MRVPLRVLTWCVHACVHNQHVCTYTQHIRMHTRARTQAAVLETELVKMSPDLDAIREFQAKAADYAHRAAELDAVTAQRDEVRMGMHVQMSAHMCIWQSWTPGMHGSRALPLSNPHTVHIDPHVPSSECNHSHPRLGQQACVRATCVQACTCVRGQPVCMRVCVCVRRACVRAFACV